MPISMLKYVKIHKNTPTCFDLNRSSSGSMSVSRYKVTELFKKHCPTHSTTRVTTYTCYTCCCHNTGNDLQEFKFSVF